MPAPHPLQRLRDIDAWQRLDAEPEAILVIGTAGCGACRLAARVLPEVAAQAGLPLFWAEAEDAPGLVAALDVFHLPAVFWMHEGEPVSLEAPLQQAAMQAALTAARGTLRPTPPPVPGMTMANTARDRSG